MSRQLTFHLAEPSWNETFDALRYILDRFQGLPIFSFEDIDQLHLQPVGRAAWIFRKYRDNFDDGVDYIRDESGTAHLTPAGYLRVIMPFEDELSWLLHEMVIDACCRAKVWRRLGDFFPEFPPAVDLSS